MVSGLFLDALGCALVRISLLPRAIYKLFEFLNEYYVYLINIDVYDKNMSPNMMIFSFFSLNLNFTKQLVFLNVKLIQLIITELGGTPSASASRNKLLLDWLGALAP